MSYSTTLTPNDYKTLSENYKNFLKQISIYALLSKYEFLKIRRSMKSGSHFNIRKSKIIAIVSDPDAFEK